MDENLTKHLFIKKIKNSKSIRNNKLKALAIFNKTEELNKFKII